MSCKTVIVWKSSGLWRNRTHAQVHRQSFSILELLGPRQQVFMKRSQQSHASRFWSSLLVLAVLMIFATATAAQTEESPVVLPTAISDSVTKLDANALVSTDATPATVVPAREHDATSLSANALMPTLATVTEFPATGSSSTTPSVATIPGVATIEAPPAATAVASAVTGSTAGAEAPTSEVPTPAPGATEVLTPPLVPNDAQTAAPPVATSAIITLQNATEIPAAPPIATEAPTAASVATNASTTTSASTPLPPAVPMPGPVATTQAPPAASNTTVAPPMPAPAATAPKPPTSTPATADTTAFRPPMPPSDASKLKTAESSGTDSTSKSSSSTSKNAAGATKELADDSVADTPTGDTEGSSGLLKLAPILPDDTDADADTDTDTDTDIKTDIVDAPTNDYDSDSAPSNASTSSPHSQSLNDWELVLVIMGAVCAVVASIFFMHKRTAAANRRLRDTVSRRALESFFWRNRVTVVRETTLSSNAEPLTPRNDIPITTSFGERSRVKTSMPIPESEAKDLDRNTQLNSTTRIVASPDDYDGNKHDSFTDPKSSSVSFNIPVTTHYAYLDMSFVSIGSNAPSISSSQSSIFEEGPGTMNRTERSSNGFSVSNMSSDGGTCRLTSQLLNRFAVPLSMSKSAPTSDTRDSSRRSDDCSVDESYTESFTTQLSSTNDSFISIGENSTSQSTQDIDDNSSTTSDLSEKSAQNEGEI
ncbi:unnamed protein product [Peronospora destructor]|uniref:Uncharacterized protein n=1 Tax=Peronospora destructor TaxID=86335 RepID=A0AAV0SX28_9STRA|nr:unnamed protein product [Peronospora destructor]